MHAMMVAMLSKKVWVKLPSYQSRRWKGIRVDTYRNEERFRWMTDGVPEGPGEQEEAREDENRKCDKEKEIQYENNGSDCNQATEFVRGDCE